MATLDGIHLHGPRDTPMRSVAEATLEAERGIVGDRYFGLGIDGTHVTFIAAEGVEAMVNETGIPIAPIETRRNLLTRGIELDSLIGRRFRVGEAVCFGVKHCSPCNHLESVTRPGVREGLSGRGGLRADVVEGGVIRVGDTIELLPE
jgi:MOSC domain-containing protein YiiM